MPYQQASLFRAILDQPASDLPRLVYADWLEEHGGEADRARAEFIRVQIERARLPDEDPRAEALRLREKSLLEAGQDAWTTDLPDWARPGAEFRRGFAAV